MQQELKKTTAVYDNGFYHDRVLKQFINGTHKKIQKGRTDDNDKYHMRLTLLKTSISRTLRMFITISEILDSLISDHDDIYWGLHRNIVRIIKSLSQQRALCATAQKSLDVYAINQAEFKRAFTLFIQSITERITRLSSTILPEYINICGFQEYTKWLDSNGSSLEKDMLRFFTLYDEEHDRSSVLDSTDSVGRHEYFAEASAAYYNHFLKSVQESGIPEVNVAECISQYREKQERRKNKGTSHTLTDQEVAERNREEIQEYAKRLELNFHVLAKRNGIDIYTRLRERLMCVPGRTGRIIVGGYRKPRGKKLYVTSFGENGSFVITRINFDIAKIYPVDDDTEIEDDLCVLQKKYPEYAFAISTITYATPEKLESNLDDSGFTYSFSNRRFLTDKEAKLVEEYTKTYAEYIGGSLKDFVLHQKYPVNHPCKDFIDYPKYISIRKLRKNTEHGYITIGITLSNLYNVRKFLHIFKWNDTMHRFYNPHNIKMSLQLTWHALTWAKRPLVSRTITASYIADQERYERQKEIVESRPYWNFDPTRDEIIGNIRFTFIYQLW